MRLNIGMEKNSKYIGISNYNFQVGDNEVTLKELKKNGEISSKVETLKDFGFNTSFFFSSLEKFEETIIQIAQKTIEESNLKKNDFEYLFLYLGIPANLSINKSGLEHFNYLVGKVAYKLGLSNTKVITMSEQGCSGSFSIIDIAKKYLLTSNKKAILCISADMLPDNLGREIIYNIISDACSSYIIRKNSPKNRIISFYNNSQLQYYDTKKNEQIILASYFPFSKQTIINSLKKTNLNLNDIKYIVPHNVSKRSWEILSKLIEFPVEKVWLDNISKYGHTVSCDHIINLKQLEDSGKLEKGDKLLLFTFGFGCYWSTIILEY